MNNFLKFIKNTIINNKSLFLKSLIFIFFIIGIQALLPISMRWIIDSVSANQSISFLVLGIISYALILIISNFLDVAWMKFLDKLGGKIIDDIRTELYKSINLANYEDLIMIGKEKLKNILYNDEIKNYLETISGAKISHDQLKYLQLDIETKNLLLKIEQEIIKTKKDCIFFKITHEDIKDIEYTQTISV